jgi:hypothetical protein
MSLAATCCFSSLLVGVRSTIICLLDTVAVAILAKVSAISCHTAIHDVVRSGLTFVTILGIRTVLTPMIFDTVLAVGPTIVDVVVPTASFSWHVFVGPGGVGVGVVTATVGSEHGNLNVFGCQLLC